MNHAFSISVAVIAFETVLLVLMLVKFVQALLSGWGDAPVLTVVVRDGIWAFALVFGTPATPSSLCLHSRYHQLFCVSMPAST